MATKKRLVDIVSPTLRFQDELPIERRLKFEDIITSMNGAEYRYKEKIFEMYILKTSIADCILGLIETTQDRDIPPIKDKNTKEYSKVNINPATQGLAYANVFIYDKRLNVLIYEVNRNGCFLTQLISFLYSVKNEKEESIPFDLKFASILRREEYERMLRMNYYKKITLEIYNPKELINCLNEETDSVASTLLRSQIQAAQDNNADTLKLEQVSLGKKINPLGLSHSGIKETVDLITSIARNGFKKNIQTLEVQGYSSDVDADGRAAKSVNLLADTFNEYFTIPDIQIQSDVQKADRQKGIEDLYNKTLPEIKSIIKQ